MAIQIQEEKYNLFKCIKLSKEAIQFITERKFVGKNKKGRMIVHEKDGEKNKRKTYESQPRENTRGCQRSW